MSGVSKKSSNMTVLPKSDVKSKRNSKDETIQCWNTSFSRGTSGSSRSYLYNPFFNRSHETKMSATPILLDNYLNSKKPVLKISNNDGPITESKKRNRSKPGPASRKRSKKKQLDEAPDEKNLDTDLVAFVESMNTEKKLDSDSSTDTIIIDSEVNCKPCNKAAETTSKVTNIFSTDNRTLSLGSNIHLADNFASQQNEKVADSSLPLHNSSLIRNSYAPSSSVLKDYLLKDASVVHPISNAFKFSSSLGPLSIPLRNTKAKKGIRKAQQKSFMYDSESPLTNKRSSESNANINLPHSNVVEHSAKSFQSIYASMGLDEDLCDVKSHTVGENLSNFVPDSSLPSTKEIHSQDSVQNFTDIPIKIEKNVTPPASPGNGESRIRRDMFDESRNSLNKMHVDMTFEADPYDEEDDLPLSVLKSKVDESSSEANSKCNVTNQSMCSSIPISLFIKKELIEDEIVSKDNLTSSLKTDVNLLNSNSQSSLNLEVKIKSEPITDIEYCESSKTICPETLCPNPFDLSAKSNNEIVPENSNLSKKSKKGKQKNTKRKINRKSIISSLSSNEAIPSTCFIDSYSVPEMLNNEAATSLVVPKKNKVKKTSKRTKTTVNLEANYNLNSENVQNTDSCKSSVNLTSSAKPLDIPCTDFDTSTNLIIAENTAISKKKGKKKKVVKKSVHLDENLPITLLIKRQKTADINTNGMDSFLCTKISKCGIDEVKGSFAENSSDNHKQSELLNSEVPFIQNLDNSSSSFLNSDSKQTSSKKKKKNSTKRKSAKKRDTFGKFEESPQVSCEQENNKQSNNLLNIMTNKKCESPYDTNVCNSNNLNKGISENHTTKDNTVVHMSFEEQHSPPDDSSEEFMNSILSVKKESKGYLFPDSVVHSRHDSTCIPSAVENIKKENDYISESESCEQSKSTVSDEQNSRISTPGSGFSPELGSSNLNFKDVSNDLSSKDTNDSPSKSEKTDSVSKKKKKGKKRSYGWYKKKGQRAKRKDQLMANALLSDTDFYASTSAPISDTEFYAPAVPPMLDTDFFTSAKQPVVVVKNLLPGIEKNRTSHEIDKDCLNAELERVLLLTKDKINNSCKTSKRKRAPESNKKSPNKKLLLEASESENNSIETPMNTADPTNQSSNSEKNSTENILLEGGNTKSVITRFASEEAVYIPFDHLPDNQGNEVIDISDSPIKISDRSQPGKRLHSPLIDVAEMAQEIAGLENLVHSYSKQHDHETVNNIIFDSPERNEHECVLKTPEIAGIKNQSTASLCNSSIKPSIGLNLLHTEPQNINLIEPLAKIKKEPDVYRTYEANIDSHPHNLNSVFGISDTLQPVHNLSKTRNLENKSQSINSVSIKSEASSNSVSYIQARSQNSNEAPNTYDNNYSSESCTTNMSKNMESLQLKSAESSDKIALSIKKEVCNSVYGSSINAVRSQNELLNKASEIRPEPVTINLKQNNASCSRQEFNSASPQSKTPIAAVQNGMEAMTDDEIQILEVNTQKSKNVPCVDLTDDVSNVNTKVQENNSLVNCSKPVSEFCDYNKSIVHGNTISEKIAHDVATKKAIFSVDENKYLVSNEYNLESTKLPSERNIFQSSFSDDDLYSSTEKETIDPFILRQKYINEYFRYPFPPSVASFHSKPQKKHKTYIRIHSQTLNLSIEKVESRLKNSNNIKQKFGNKLGDIVKLERYPVNSSEVECYHRILGIAPSHKLLSKCFKSPDKKAGSVLDEFSLFPELQGQSSVSKFENKNPSITCSLQDIIKGISESRMMCDKSDIQTPEILKRDCPSIDTKDSCDSFTSSVSDRFVHSGEKNDIKIKNSLLKDSDPINLCQDASSSGRNSSLSCATSDFQDSIRNDSEIENFSKNCVQERRAHSSDANESSFSQNILSYLTLPSKEVLDSLVNNESSKSLTNMDIHEERTNTGVELKKVQSTDLHSVPNSNEQLMSVPPLSADNSYISNTSEDCNILQKVTNPVLNIDLPVTELRKILEVAGSFSLGSNNNEINLWKNKETFEYNHTMSVPVTGTKSDQNLENATFSLNSNSVATVENKFNRDDVKDDPVHENSDDDYVDNEPQYCESDVDKNETSDVNEKEEEEPKIPQYKSKWEKIMERKSLESKKEHINEHLLKDCFPVSSKVPSKKCNVPNKTSINATPKISESKKTENREVKKTKSDQKTKAKPDQKAKAKSDKKPLGAEKEQSKVISKKEKIKSNKTENKYKECTKESKLLPKKRKGKYVDDAINLFAPDKPVKITDDKKAESSNKSNDNNAAKCFYGNRITNRGTFLTESSSEFLKNVKISKKKISEIPKKPVNVRSEEFHSMVKSPDIDIQPRHGSRYDRTNLIVVTTGETSNYRIRKRNKYFDRGSSSTNSSILLHPPEGENLQNKRTFMDTQPSDLFRPSYHESFSNRKVSFLSNPSLPQQTNDENNRNVTLLNTPFNTNDESNPYRNVPLLNNSSISYPSKDANFSNTKVPFINIPPSTSMEFPPNKNILSNTSPPLTLLQNILSNVQNNSSMASNDAALPFSGYLNPAWNNSQYPSTPAQPYFSDVSDSMSDSMLTNTSSATDLPSLACNLVPGPPSSNFQFHNQPNHSFDPVGINSQFITSNQICHPTKKALSTCLVPQNLKSSVGHETVETSNVRLLMLEWSVDWLVQQQKFHDPPPIYKALKKVVSSYDNFEDYYNTYFPLMLLDTWHRIYVSWTHLSQASPYFCEISSYSVKSNFVSVECQTVFNSTDHPKGVFPDEGSILMIKYGTKSNEFAIKILGYVTCVKTRRFNPVTDSKLCNFKPPRDGNFEILNVLTLTFMGAYNSEDIDKRLPIRIHVLCNVRSTLKQNDALLYISKSPLQRNILNPVGDGLLSFSLTPRNSPQDKVNECVRDITKGILSVHPLPLLTIVRALPESDRLNIIPLLIEKMKTVYKTKVLLCVRTVRALGDIAANICLHESLKMVIINKRCDTGVQFQRYLLDELVASEISKSEDGSLERHLAKNEAVMRTKKQIFSECDVVLSLIRNSHDEFMETTFTETESVAQMCCIVDEANLCTEPETLIPVLHGVSKLILIGDPDYPAKVVSKTAKEYDYNRSFFHRAYDLDLITE